MGTAFLASRRFSFCAFLMALHAAHAPLAVAGLFVATHQLEEAPAHQARRTDDLLDFPQGRQCAVIEPESLPAVRVNGQRRHHAGFEIGEVAVVVEAAIAEHAPEQIERVVLPFAQFLNAAICSAISFESGMKSARTWAMVRSVGSVS